MTKDKDSGLVNYKGLNKTQPEDEIQVINEVHLPKENRLSKLEEVAICIIYGNQQIEVKHEETKESVPTKELDKFQETYFNEMEISVLPDREFKIIVIKMLAEVTRAKHE